MIPELTDDMRKATREHPDRPIRVADPETQSRYMLLSAEACEQVLALLWEDSEASPDELLPLAHEAFQEDWDAAGMELYDD